MASNNSFVEQGIALVHRAIEADQAQDFENAMNLYREALQRLTLGIKYENNPARKRLLTERVEGYMKRAEELRDHMDKEEKKTDDKKKDNADGTASSPEKGGETKELDADTKKLRGALAGVIVAEKPNVKWSDVAGLEGAKESLKETVILPVKFPQLFVGERKPFKGILLFGPPGTGKSYLAKAVATEADSTFFAVSSADLISKWQGESERLVRNLFEMAREQSAQEGSGRAIIFIDEVDSLCGTRSEGEADSSRRVKTEFLVQMDGVGNAGGSVLVLGASNVPWDLDAAIRRRFEKRVYISLPEQKARTFMFKLHTGVFSNDLKDITPHCLTDADFEELGRLSEGASGSDIEVIVKEALMEPIRKCQQARQFHIDENGKYIPCAKYPSCSRCPPKLSTDPPGMDYTCKVCKAVRMTLWDIPEPEKLDAPPVRADDFKTVMKHAFSTVSEAELKRYQDWTAMFGQEGA